MIFIEIYAKLLTKIKTFSHNLFAGKTREGVNKINQTDQRNERNSRNSRNQRTPMVLLRNFWMSPAFIAWVGSIRPSLKIAFV